MLYKFCYSLSNTLDLTEYFLSNKYLENINKKSKEYKFTHQWVRLLSFSFY